jgi:hypothetical protein
MNLNTISLLLTMVYTKDVIGGILESKFNMFLGLNLVKIRTLKSGGGELYQCRYWFTPGLRYRRVRVLVKLIKQCSKAIKRVGGKRA